MQCARCGSAGIKFYNIPSRKRGEFLERTQSYEAVIKRASELEQVCKRCRDLDRQEQRKSKAADLRAKTRAEAAQKDGASKISGTSNRGEKQRNVTDPPADPSLFEVP